MADEPPIDLTGLGTWIRRGNHSHRCPECYEDKPCADLCAIEPDCSDWDVSIPWNAQIVKARGDITPCGDCRERTAGKSDG